MPDHPFGGGASSMSQDRAEGFAYEVHGGDVVINHHGRKATVLRGRRAEEFLASVAAHGVDDDQSGQDLMARLTGDYRRGNERQARQHPRNHGRR
jgi:hypothetical protein